MYRGNFYICRPMRKNHVISFVAALLTVWYLACIAGFDLHTCNESGRSFVGSLVERAWSDEGHCFCCDLEGEEACGCHEGHGVEGCEGHDGVDDGCCCSGDCCSDDVKMLVVTGLDDDEGSLYLCQCFSLLALSSEVSLAISGEVFPVVPICDHWTSDWRLSVPEVDIRSLCSFII